MKVEFAGNRYTNGHSMEVERPLRPAKPTLLRRHARIMRVCLPVRLVIRVGLIAPDGPAFANTTAEEFQVRTPGTVFDDFVLLIRFAGMFAFAGLDHVHLATLSAPVRRAAGSTREVYFGTTLATAPKAT